MDCSLPGSSVQGILQERILEWVSFPSPDPGIESMILTSPALAGSFFTTSGHLGSYIPTIQFKSQLIFFTRC